MQSVSHDPGKLGDVIVNLKDAESYELGLGTQIKLLRYSEETGDWVLWVSMAPGSTFAPHWHLGPGQYFVTEGELIYDVGSAPAGTYGYEPVGSKHAEAHCLEQTEFLFMGQGAVAYTEDDGSIKFIMNHEFLRDLAAGIPQPDISNSGN
jgi:hypothetical protein